MTLIKRELITQVQELRSKLVKAETAAAEGGNARSEAEAAELAQLRQKSRSCLRSEARLRRQLLEVRLTQWLARVILGQV